MSPVALVSIERLVVHDVRNLEHLVLEPAPRTTVISGDNGQGKTALLEAIYLAASTRSFRTSKLAEVVRHGAAEASVQLSVLETSRDGLEHRRRQDVTLRSGRIHPRLDNKRPPSALSYALRTPAVVFHTGELELSTGSAVARRRLLDRVSLFVAPSLGDAQQRYRRAHRGRQELLRREGVAARGLDALESVAATEAARLSEARRLAALALIGTLGDLFARLASAGTSLSASYAPGGPADAASLVASLRSARSGDLHRPAASVGPHRDDLRLELDGHLARQVASLGQHRALTLALKLAEAEAIARAAGRRPVLLLDDVSSELDRSRLEALFRLLDEQAAQVLLTTTRPEWIPRPRDEADHLEIRLAGGSILSS